MIRYVPDHFHSLPQGTATSDETMVGSPSRIVVPVRRGHDDREFGAPPRRVRAIEPEAVASPDLVTHDAAQDESLVSTRHPGEALQEEPGEAREQHTPEEQNDEAPESRLPELQRKHEIGIEALHGFKARSDALVESRRRQEQDAMLLELLPVQDSLDRALAEKGAEENAWTEGLASIRRQLLSFLSKYDVQPLDALGEQFNPHFHEAILAVKDRVGEDGQILHVEEQGYLRGDKLLRPAKVIVMKDPEG